MSQPIAWKLWVPPALAVVFGAGALWASRSIDSGPPPVVVEIGADPGPRPVQPPPPRPTPPPMRVPSMASAPVAPPQAAPEPAAMTPPGEVAAPLPGQPYDRIGTPPGIGPGAYPPAGVPAPGVGPGSLPTPPGTVGDADGEPEAPRIPGQPARRRPFINKRSPDMD